MKNGYTLLVVEDDGLYRGRLCVILRDNTTWTIVEASDATEALNIVSNNADAIDAILLDAHIPPGEGGQIHHRNDNRHGIECAKHVLNLTNKFRVIGMSVTADEDTKVWFERNADGFLDKSDFKLNQLPNALAVIIGSHDCHISEDDIENVCLQSPNSGDGKRNRVDKRISDGPRITVNTKMIATLQHTPDAAGWSSREWAMHLNCAPSTVCGTPTWKSLAEQQKFERAARAVSKRRNGRSMEDQTERSD